MLTKFEEQILSDDERGFFHGYDLPLGVESHTTVDNQSNNSGGAIAVRRRSRRQIPTRRSSLEDLPVPRESFDSQSRQTRQRTRSYDARRSSRQARSTRVEERSVLESSGLRTLEQLSSNSRQGLRGRTVQGGRRFSVRQQNARQAAPEVPMPRRSSRPGLRNSVDAEIPSINEEQQVHLSQARSVTRDERGSRRIHISTRHAEANTDDMVSHDEPESERQASRQRRDTTTTLTRNSVARAASRPAHCNESSQTETNHSERFSGSVSSSDDSGEEVSPTPMQRRTTRTSTRSSVERSNSQAIKVNDTRRSHALVSRSADDMSFESNDIEEIKAAPNTRRATRAHCSARQNNSSADEQLSGQDSEFDAPLEAESSDSEDSGVKPRASRARPAKRKAKQTETPKKKAHENGNEATARLVSVLLILVLLKLPLRILTHHRPSSVLTLAMRRTFLLLPPGNLRLLDDQRRKQKRKDGKVRFESRKAILFH